ncbi:MAG TPA: NAD-dependent epimerase/dehydratase family protein [Bosea sp. (in: a-proteobacteria)]|jgi:dihydroflavonol-4-reductase|uniref:NAD-dependent epimerase/dehydratase family protein n=1 Tax=Bosea sp. (in: a-proteobacteria) TaxID=1871050 RepID=UPI002E11D623|nr:NAD-dependent epimerase/dehydratase family protein [Bosea sp. (in: a-proteobacteria)]
MPSERILVTGGAGFLAGHCILALLRAGYAVRTTLRDPAREQALRAMLAGAGVETAGRLDTAVADLTADDGWAQAAAGCDAALHVASPLPAGAPRDEDELIRPAREGTLRVLRAARAAGMRRVVLTSSFAAIGYGKHLARPYTESDWTDPTLPGLAAYPKSKTLAERAAWDFVDGEGGGLELAVVNPVGIFGPLLAPDLSASILLIRSMLEGKLPALPRLMFGVVDARDVADLHLRALTDPAAAGERFIATAGDFLTMQEIALALRDRLGPAADKVSTRVLPDWLVRFVARFSAAARQAATPELGRSKTASSAKARAMLGWEPRPAVEALAATGESLIRLGLIRR